MNFEEFKKHDGYNALFAGGVLLVICPFLPWLIAKGTHVNFKNSMSGMDLQSEMILLCGLGSLIAYLSWNAMTKITTPNPTHLKVGTGASTALFLFYYNGIDEATKTIQTTYWGRVNVSTGFGVFVAFVACGAMCFGLYKVLHAAKKRDEAIRPNPAPPAPAPPAPAPPAPAPAPPAPAPAPAPITAQATEQDADETKS